MKAHTYDAQRRMLVKNDKHIRDGSHLKLASFVLLKNVVRSLMKALTNINKVNSLFAFLSKILEGLICEEHLKRSKQVACK